MSMFWKKMREGCFLIGSEDRRKKWGTPGKTMMNLTPPPESDPKNRQKENGLLGLFVPSGQETRTRAGEGKLTIGWLRRNAEGGSHTSRESRYLN